MIRVNCFSYVPVTGGQEKGIITVGPEIGGPFSGLPRRDPLNGLSSPFWISMITVSKGFPYRVGPVKCEFECKLFGVGTQLAKVSLKIPKREFVLVC